MFIKELRGDCMECFKEVLHTENVVAIGLVIALFLAIFYGSNELSTSIASGLLGYIGRSKLSK